MNGTGTGSVAQPRSRLGASAFLLLALLLVAFPTRAQTPGTPRVEVSDTVREIRLTDGSVVYGRIVSVEADRVVIETEAGARIEVERAQIRSVQPVRGRVVRGEVWTEDPTATRLFFAPTGRALSRGEGYVGVYELFFPFVTFGVTDRFTIAGGTPIIPEAIGEFAYVAPKLLLVDGPNTAISVGVFAGLFDGGTAGILYGVGTWGDRDNAVTAGAGWGYFAGNGEREISNDPLFMVGGETRVGRRVKLITENYFVAGESIALISGGLRIWGERLSADGGLGAGLGEGESFCCIPVVNFVYSFGGGR